MVTWVIGGTVLALVVLSDATKLTKEFALNARPPTANDKNETVPPDEWFQQYLDHFNITDNREWKQRYQVIKEHYKEGGPVFLLLGGEWAISGKKLLTYTVNAYAKKYNAMVFQLEHRFYGESHPTDDVSTENLYYLSADQSLADAAYFLKGMNIKHELPSDTKWIVFGGSYAANLAAWMRDKYSHLVYAAVADSGPVLAKVNFYEYLNVVKETLARSDPECVTAIQEAHVKVKELLKTTEGQCIVNKKFKLCDPIDVTNKKDVLYMLGYLADNFAVVVQNNGSYNTTIEQVCKIMLNTSISDVIDRYAEVNALVEKDEGTNCTDYKNDKFVKEVRNTSWEADKVTNACRQWFYQTCTEYGYFQTSTEKGHLFYEDIPLNLYFEECSDIYGDAFNKELVYKGVNRTNTIYGGLDSQATRVAYIYSEDDPWHALGNTETKVAESPVIYIKGASHCALYSADLTESGSQAVKDAWYQVQDLVGKWCTE